MIRWISVLSLLLLVFNAPAQIDQYSIEFRSIDIPGWEGVQSFTFAQVGNEVLIVGGRRDGLHRRQPWASFDQQNQNASLVVLNLATREVWSWTIAGLPVFVMDQLSSTNINFHQEGDQLLLIGGYGYSRELDDHTTFDRLIRIDIRGVIEGVKRGDVSKDLFDYIQHPDFAVTGGRLLKLYDTYYLAGGQNFQGRYNPMNHPTFVQEYTNAIRRFKLDLDNLVIEWRSAWRDEELLHRRDLNVQPIVTSEGQEGFVLYSGVFQKNQDLPFLNAVHVDSSGYKEINGFMQLFNHYHCASLPLYDGQLNEMTTIFFGGMAQYFTEDGHLMRDDNVPFVTTIGRVSRNANGGFYEDKFETEMPGLIGSGAEFIINPDIPMYSNGVVNWSAIEADSVFLGYIVGGIASSDKNIFFINDGTQSKTLSTVLEVFAIKKTSNSVSNTNETFFIHAFPNPSSNQITINFSLHQGSNVSIDLVDQNGQLVTRFYQKKLQSGWRSFTFEFPENVQSGQYFVRVMREDRIGRQVPIVKK